MSGDIIVYIDSWSISGMVAYDEPTYIEIILKVMAGELFVQADILREAAKVLNAKADDMDGVQKPIMTDAPMLGGDRRQTRERNRK